ncbi:MAG TPA: DUF695 domain-containing protein [Kofleriaceae bacterium]|nr:DUF695 domain-containing protein [Kofleriaceae bacterium]
MRNILLCIALLATVNTAGCSRSKRTAANEAVPAPAPAQVTALSNAALFTATASWAFFFEDRPGPSTAGTNDHPMASVTVDLQFTKAQQPAFGTLVQVHLAMPSDPQGMGNRSESERLHPVEDALSALGVTQQALFVGHRRSQGDWMVAFYCVDGARFATAVATAMTAFPAVTFTTDVKADPTWQVYRSTFLPNDAEQRQIADDGVLMNLKSQGDPLTTPRRVDHWLYFNDAANRVACRAELLAEGFEALPLADVNQGRYPLQVFRSDPLQRPSIHTLLEHLRLVAITHHGEYDGWETFALKPGEAAPGPATPPPVQFPKAAK